MQIESWSLQNFSIEVFTLLDFHFGPLIGKVVIDLKVDWCATIHKGLSIYLLLKLFDVLLLADERRSQAVVRILEICENALTSESCKGKLLPGFLCFVLFFFARLRLFLLFLANGVAIAKVVATILEEDLHRDGHYTLRIQKIHDTAVLLLILVFEF